jgi:hypothetical protein
VAGHLGQTHEIADVQDAQRNTKTQSLPWHLPIGRARTGCGATSKDLSINLDTKSKTKIIACRVDAGHSAVGFRFGFIPQTFILPQELKILKQSWEYKNGGGGEAWIIKPVSFGLRISYK